MPQKGCCTNLLRTAKIKPKYNDLRSPQLFEDYLRRMLISHPATSTLLCIYGVNHDCISGLMSPWS
jgi:hypothetical protein